MGLLVLVAALLAVAAAEVVQLESQWSANAAIRDDIAAQDLAGSAADAQELDPDGLERRLQTLHELRASQQVPFAILGLVQNAVPEDSWLTRLELNERNVVIQGRTRDPGGVSSLMDSLQNSPCFEDVALRGVEGRVGGEEASSFWVEAARAEARGDCLGGPPAGGRDPFDNGIRTEQAAAAPRHPLRRWDLLDYVVETLFAGEGGLLVDPEGTRHTVKMGTYVGSGRARVTFIMPDVLILTEDILVNAETGQTESHIHQLRLEQ